MNDLVEFLRARLDEDRSLAQQALDTPASDVELYATWPRQRVPFGMTFDPARVLREVEAKRTLLNFCERALSQEHPVPHDKVGDMAMASITVIYLALPYADHPDYKEKWRP